MHTAEVSVDTDLKPKRIARRYLDLPKFLDLLRSRALYMRRADGFSDRFEGALTPAIRRGINEGHRKGDFKCDADRFYQKARVGNFVNCWSLGANDNMALWHLYGGVTTSLAITTTVEKLTKVALAWMNRC